MKIYRELLNEVVESLNSYYLHKNVKFYLNTTGPTIMDEKKGYYQYTLRLVAYIPNQPNLVIAIRSIIVKSLDDEGQVMESLAYKLLVDMIMTGIVEAGRRATETYSSLEEQIGVSFQEYKEKL